MFKTLFRKWWRWVNYYDLEKPQVIQEEVVEEVWPEDIWDRVFKLAQSLKGVRLKPMGPLWFDYKPALFTSEFGELVGRLEMIAQCLASQSDAPASWEERRREVEPISIPDYSYDLIVGYRTPQFIMDMLIEKVMVIHHLLDASNLSRRDSYSVYLRRTFSSVIADTVELLTIHSKEVVKSEE